MDGREWRNSGERRMVGREGRGMVGRARKGGEVEGKEGWRDGDGREGKEGWKEGVVGMGKKRKRKELRETGMMRSSSLPLK